MQTSLQRIHPLVAAAAVSVILVSMLGVATITGVLPQSNSQTKAALSSSQPKAKVSSAYLVANALAGRTSVRVRPVTVDETLAPGETLMATPTASSTPPPAVVTHSAAVPVTLLTSMPPANRDATGKPLVNSMLAGRGEGHAAGTLRVPRTSVERASDRPETATSGATASGNHASGALHAGERRQRVAREPQFDAAFDAAVDPATSESRQVQKIVPVYRDQRMPSSTASSVRPPGYRAETVAIWQAAPAYRRARRSDGEANGMGEANRSNDSGADGPATRFGTTLGRSLGDGIDRTISAITDVLTGARLPAQSPQRSAVYGEVPGDH